MALTVEDGTTVEGANSYVTIDEAEDYFLDRVGATWHDADDDSKIEALIIGCFWLDASFSWVGYPTTEEVDRLQWPRSEAYSRSSLDYSGVIPENLKRAQCEAAEAYLAGKLPVVLERGGATRKEKVGPIEVEYATGATGGYTYPLVWSLVSDLVKGGAGRKLGRSW